MDSPPAERFVFAMAARGLQARLVRRFDWLV
jgi:hypothetical protein